MSWLTKAWVSFPQKNWLWFTNLQLMLTICSYRLGHTQTTSHIPRPPVTHPSHQSHTQTTPVAHPDHPVTHPDHQSHTQTTSHIPRPPTVAHPDHQSHTQTTSHTSRPPVTHPSHQSHTQTTTVSPQWWSGRKTCIYSQVLIVCSDSWTVIHRANHILPFIGYNNYQLLVNLTWSACTLVYWLKNTVLLHSV